MKTAKELITELNSLDEHPKLEAKACADGQLGDSFFQTVCAFSNEPGLGGGTILLGVSRNEADFFGSYDVHGVSAADKIQQDISSGCSNCFNSIVRPHITVENYEGKTLIIVEVDELSSHDKPLFFQKQSLPRAAWRRIGSTDQRSSDEDMVVFYGNRAGESYDLTILKNASLADLDPDAIEHYRVLRKKVNATAEELQWDDTDLLSSLNAIKKDGDEWKPTITGLLLFGDRKSLRRELPMVRVDYIRVAGKDWVSDPDQRFEKTIDMRGPLLQMVDRVLAAVIDDLPKGFELKEGKAQAETPTLPSRVLREAIVNALMHRSYREHQPTQVIRYSNRIEIKNAGFSLKNEDSLGETGSQLRNPTLAAVFHETNTAETKGSGIRTMRKLMEENGFSLPTFESNRADNFFVSRFLLHHFLSEYDLIWLSGITHPLSDTHRIALIFLREQGAIDNQTLRQLTNCDVLTASIELRKLRDLNLCEQKGKGSATYYLPGILFPPHRTTPQEVNKRRHNGKHNTLDTQHGILDIQHGTLAPQHGTLAPQHGTLALEIPLETQKKLNLLGKRPGKIILRPLILELCSAVGALTAEQLADALGKRNPRALKADHLREMIANKELGYLYPDMEKHPQQAYQTLPKA